MISFKTAQDVCYLMSCAVNGITPERERVERMDIDAVYALASEHMLKAVAAFTLEKAGFRDKRTNGAVAAALRRAVAFDRAFSDVKKPLRKTASGICRLMARS